ncbi:type II/IV secretion system protein [Rhodoferax sp. AJA081-3]|uniref:GspE/PulE family protein n=1 Tax=Rhodoferax sp. AJA081-3 TaxID=2752316 RepID=UPI001AE04C5E|nr:GspE/PulE family protein [Rhodoferax sp. AJA081-3]QTN27738.1 type II/IV secretion system protein [Rhodoferax sp. AJA081-3]
MTEPDFELPHDVLLGGDFSRRLGQHGAAEPVQTTAPAPLDGGGAVFTPQQMGLVSSLESLLELLRQGVFSVLPLESTGPLEQGAGHTSLVEGFKARSQHPLEDSAELAARVLSQLPNASTAHPTQQDINNTLRVAGVLNRVPVVELAEFEPQTPALECLPLDVAARLNVLPLLREGDLLVVALAEPLDAEQQHLIRFVTQCRVVAVLATHDGIQRAIGRCYASHDDADELDSLAVGEIGSGSEEDEMRIWSEAEALARQAPIVRLVNNLLADAVSRRASDIHIRPGQKTFEVLYRINGTLVSVRTLRRALLPPVVGRIKILASMNSAEHRLPQDGRIRITENHAGIDLRISIIPSQFGESVVIRILARTAEMRSLDAIGFEAADLARLRDLLRRSMGIVLVTGPTGSGKTTTLYAALQEVVRQNVNIITVEDPIEYELEGVVQIQVNPAIEFGFPTALRHILRHDPDVILIGEMRDYETAKIAVESALTGHLVFSTLHTNDAPSALVRLIEMGVAPYLIRSAVIGVLAQRLVRTNCRHCREVEPVDALMRTNLDLGPEEVFWRGVGCEHCHGTGFAGRQAIYELLVMDKQLAEHVDVGVSADVYRDSALASRMHSLPANGIKLARTGAVSLAEIYRACM